MALNLKEQLGISNIIIGGVGGVNISDLVFQGCVNKAIQFYDSVKNFDETANPKAAGYKNKMVNTCTQIIRAENGQNGIINVMMRVFASVVGLSSVTKGQVDGATESQWIGFINSNSLEVIEDIAGVTKPEADEYNAL
jgi:hypothetical protein